MLLRAGCDADRVRRRNCNGCQLLLTLYDYGGTGGADNVAAVVVDADAVRLRLVLHGCTADVVRLTLARRYMTDTGARLWFVIIPLEKERFLLFGHNYLGQLCNLQRYTIYLCVCVFTVRRPTLLGAGL